MTNDSAVRWWVPGTGTASSVFTNVVLNVIVLTGLCLRVKLPEISSSDASPRSASRSVGTVLRVARAAARAEGGPHRRDRMPTPERPHIVHRRVRGHAAGVLKTNDAKLAWQRARVCFIIA